MGESGQSWECRCPTYFVHSVAIASCALDTPDLRIRDGVCLANVLVGANGFDPREIDAGATGVSRPPSPAVGGVVTPLRDSRYQPPWMQSSP